MRGTGRGLHRGVDLIAGAVEKSGVDEHDALAHGADAFGEIDGGPALLVHDADLEGIARQAQQILDLGEQLAGEGGFLRPVHLGLDDVDRAGARVAARGRPGKS